MARLCSHSSREPPGWDRAHTAMPHVWSFQPSRGVLNLPSCDPLYLNLVLSWMFPLPATRRALLPCGKRICGANPMGTFS